MEFNQSSSNCILDAIIVSGTISGIDFIMLGQLTLLEMQQIDHLHWFSMYLSTNAIQWKCIPDARCETNFPA